MSKRNPRKPSPVMPWGDLPRGPRLADTAGGILIIDKPTGVTSHDIVGAVRRLAGTRKVGHAGTLDPMATGVLVVGIGQATKLLTYLVGEDKEYASRFRFGIDTTTEDATGEVTLARGCKDTDAEIDEALRGQTGDIMQVPSSFSAKKVDGRRAYDMARAGEVVELEAVPIHVSRCERVGNVERSVCEIAVEGDVEGDVAGVPATTFLEEYTEMDVLVEDATRNDCVVNSAIEDCYQDVPVSGVPVADVSVAIACSSGTYVRAIARDAGESLGTGAHMTALRRTRVGAWRAEDAHTVEEYAEKVRAGESLPAIGMAEAASLVMPSHEITPEESANIRMGRFIEAPRGAFYPMALTCEGELVAVAVGRANKGSAGKKNSTQPTDNNAEKNTNLLGAKVVFSPHQEICTS
ncbi:tRNA pseudouridine(55) synthase TruB [Actinotignum urinale]